MTDSSKAVVALTGATGFVGRYLLDHLTKTGRPVRPISRSGGGAIVACGDLAYSTPDWGDLFAGADTVIHCAAIAHQPLDDSRVGKELKRKLYRVNRDAVAEVAEGCMAAGVRRLIFLSTVKVYGESTRPGEAFKETDALNPQDDYGESKKQAEEVLRAFRQRGLEVCCLRLPLIYGPRAKANLLRLQRLAVSGMPLPLASIRNSRSLLGLNNLAIALDGLMEVERWNWSEVNIADPEPISTPELVRALGKVAGRAPLLVPFPVHLLTVMAKALGRASDIERLTENLEVSVRRLQSILSVPLVPTGDSLGLLADKPVGNADVEVGAS